MTLVMLNFVKKKKKLEKEYLAFVVSVKRNDEWKIEIGKHQSTL